MSAVIGSLYVYPIKSAAGIDCASVALATTGFRHDREWMIIDPAGRFITQRDESRLALLRPMLTEGKLAVANPHGAGPVLDLAHEGERVQVQVWGSQCAAYDAGAEMAQFLSDWLGRPLRLVRFDPQGSRLSNHDWTQGRDVPNLFSDGYPILVLSQASIDDLSARVGRALPAERFRPNIVLTGVDPYAEDRTSQLLVGDLRLHLTKACTRCVITTIDQQRGERTDDEPLRTLKGYRFDKALRGVVFGRNAYAEAAAGAILGKGDPVTLESVP
jgi:uncharacterized protein